MIPIITIFACPRPFRGQYAIIQRNAIISWTLLHPKPEIILFGEEEGIEEICQEFNLRHVPELTHNKFGTPLVSDLFEKAQVLARYDLICYINADIIITQSLIDAVNIIRKRWRRFVMVCAPWRLSMSDRIDFSSLNWENELRNLVRETGIVPTPIGADLYLFPRRYYHHIPPFAIGRTSWDSWLIYKACLGKFPFVDATQFIFTLHPSHERSTHNETYREGEEGLINHSLAGDLARTFTRLDVPYALGLNSRLQRKQVFGLVRYYIRAIKLFLLKRLRKQ